MSLLPHPSISPFSHLIPLIKSFPSSIVNHFSSNLIGGNASSSHSYLSPLSWYQYYQQADPLHGSILICAILSIYVYVMQEITGNASQVDGLWTFIPVIYSFHFAFHGYLFATDSRAGLPAKVNVPSVSSWFSKGASSNAIRQPGFWDEVQPRLALMFALSVLWSIRLTFNAYRRGMFKKGEEDYRWPLLRASMSKPMWEIFTITFIAPAQNVLLACTALPNYLLLTSLSSKHVTNPVPRPITSLTSWDFIISALFVLNLIVQFIADQQQWDYQNFKRDLDSNGKPKPKTSVATVGSGKSDGGKSLEKISASANQVLVEKSNEEEEEIGKSMFATFDQNDKKRGFVSKGLWAWSRHPNFACEQTTWWILYLFVPLTYLPVSSSKAYGSASFFNTNIGIQEYVLTYALLSPLLMNILFVASTLFSESVSAGKYPPYKAYQRRVGMFLPIDTLLRTLYYNTIASKAAKERTEQEVWGQAKGGKEI